MAPLFETANDLQEQINGLNDRLARQEGRINFSTPLVTDLSTLVEGIERRIDRLENRINTLGRRADNIDGGLRDLG